MCYPFLQGSVQVVDREGPHRPSCLGQGLMLFTTVYTVDSKASFQTISCLHVSCHHRSTGVTRHVLVCITWVLVSALAHWAISPAKHREDRSDRLGGTAHSTNKNGERSPKKYLI